MLRNPRLQPWPPVSDEHAQLEFALSHWAAARSGSKGRWWLGSSRELSRYLDNILSAHVLSARGDSRN